MTRADRYAAACPCPFVLSASVTDCPIGSRPGQKALAVLSLTSATAAAPPPRASLSVKLRPRKIGRPITAKYDGDTTLYRARTLESAVMRTCIRGKSPSNG